MLRALLFLVDAAKRAAQSAELGTATIELGSTEGVVQVRAASQGGLGLYASVMASVCGGSLRAEDGVLVLTLPSLTEVRRRERAAASE